MYQKQNQAFRNFGNKKGYQKRSVVGPEGYQNSGKSLSNGILVTFESPKRSGWESITSHRPSFVHLSPLPLLSACQPGVAQRRNKGNDTASVAEGKTSQSSSANEVNVKKKSLELLLLTMLYSVSHSVYCRPTTVPG
jgi:hypothetical protein